MNGTITFEKEDMIALEDRIYAATGLPWKFLRAQTAGGGILGFRLELGKGSWARAQSDLDSPEKLYGVWLDGDPMEVLKLYSENMFNAIGIYPWDK